MSTLLLTTAALMLTLVVMALVLGERPTILRAVLACYHSGTRQHGWECSDCGAAMEHEGKHRRVFARVTLHTIVRHRRLPHVSPATTVAVWTWES